MSQQPQPRTRRSRSVQIRWTPKLILFVILLVLALIFFLQNLGHVDVRLLFWEVRMRLVWALLIFTLVGAILGWLAPKLRSGLRRIRR